MTSPVTSDWNRLVKIEILSSIVAVIKFPSEAYLRVDEEKVTHKPQLVSLLPTGRYSRALAPPSPFGSAG